MGKDPPPSPRDVKGIFILPKFGSAAPLGFSISRLRTENSPNTSLPKFEKDAELPYLSTYTGGERIPASIMKQTSHLPHSIVEFVCKIHPEFYSFFGGEEGNALYTMSPVASCVRLQTAHRWAHLPVGPPSVCPTH